MHKSRAPTAVGARDARESESRCSFGGCIAYSQQYQAQGQFGRNYEAKLLSIKSSSRDRAILEFDYNYDVPRGGRRNTTLRWTLANREGRWLIVETEYLKK